MNEIDTDNPYAPYFARKDERCALAQAGQLAAERYSRTLGGQATHHRIEVAVGMGVYGLLALMVALMVIGVAVGG